jgi:hypothetical protein
LAGSNSLNVFGLSKICPNFTLPPSNTFIFDLDKYEKPENLKTNETAQRKILEDENTAEYLSRACSKLHQYVHKLMLAPYRYL